MATCSLLYRFFPNRNKESRSEYWKLSSIRLKDLKPLKRHGIYITNPQNMGAHSSSYQVEVRRSFHIQSSSRRENSVRPSSHQTRNQNCSSASANYPGLAEKLFYLARGRSPFLVWTAYRGPPRWPRSHYAVDAIPKISFQPHWKAIRNDPLCS